jgi:hypothetical protein
MRFLAMLAALIFMPVVVNAADDRSLCGPPPSDNTTKIITDKDKKNLDGKAQAIAKIAGSAELAGTIDHERQAIYLNSKVDEAILHDRYLAYVTCLLVVGDSGKGVSLQDKAAIIERFRRPIPGISPKTDLMEKFLDIFEKDMPLEKVREMLGAPHGRAQVSLTSKGRKLNLTLERFEGEKAFVYTLRSNKLRAIAIMLRERPSPVNTSPIPSWNGFIDFKNSTDGKQITIAEKLGLITMQDLRDLGNCYGAITPPDARWGYFRGPECDHGNAGDANFFVFASEAGRIQEDCKTEELQAKEKKSPECLQSFLDTRPNFVLVYLSDNAPPLAPPEMLADRVLRYHYWRE